MASLLALDRLGWWSVEYLTKGFKELKLLCGGVYAQKSSTFANINFKAANWQNLDSESKRKILNDIKGQLQKNQKTKQ